MATFKITFANEAGELDSKEIETTEAFPDGIDSDTFMTALMEMIGSAPIYDGDRISVMVTGA